MALGFSYQPGQNIPVNQGQGPAVSGVTPQGPAKILSLRIPRNVGPNAISPYSLLSAHGASGAPDLNAMIAALMRTMQPQSERPEDMYPSRGVGGGASIGGLFGGGPLPGAGSMFPGGQQPSQPLPAPRIIPGENDLTPGNNPQQPVNYGSPWATGVTPQPGEGDPEHNPYFYGMPSGKLGLF